MKRLVKHSATSNMVRVFILDSSSTTGAGLTGVLYTSTGLVIDMIANNSDTAYHYKSAATATIEDITTIGTYAAPSASNCRFKAVDATNFPGLYEIHFLNGVFDDAGATSVIGRVAGVTNMAPTLFEIQLVAFDPDNAVRLGLTALPNAAADAAGGLPISDAGGLDMDAILADTADMQPKLGTPAGASISADIAAIEAQTDDIGAAGAGLTAADDAILTILGTPAGVSMSADIAAVKVDTAAILVDTGTTLDGRIPAALVGGRMDSSLGAIAVGVDLSATMKTSVNAEVVDALATDTYAEPAQGTPAATNTLAVKIGHLFKAWRNRTTQTATQSSLYNDDAVTVDHKATFSDDGVTADRGEIASGP